MSSGRIFLVGRAAGELVPMAETPYATEDHLQALLANYPDLLPGDQITPEIPRRWLLVARELGIPGEEGGTGVWSLDHLFLDQDGVPTFVECKRASDTRTRREVVAQMLDYAANGTVYLPIDRLRQAAAETAQRANESVDDQVRLLLGSDDADVEAYWATVEQNLRSGRVRLVFVADQTPRDLRRLVEFLNEKMADVEVLAVEVRQFLGEDHRVVVPRVVGLSETARRTKSSAETRTRHRDPSEVVAESTPPAAELFSSVLADAKDRAFQVYPGAVGFSIRRQLRASHARNTFAYCYPPALFQLYLQDLTASPERETALRQRLLENGALEERGKFTLQATVDRDNVEALRAAWTEMVSQLDDIAKEEWDTPLPGYTP